jgi:single-stranded-DNA-specific exonuclease
MEGLSQALWLFGVRDEAAETKLAMEIGASPLVAALLIQRGYDTPAKATAFLKPTLNQLHDPSLLPDYELAKREIMDAVTHRNLIYVHGDYDADGVTSTAILTRFLTGIGARVNSHVPHRIHEGYGIHPDAIDRAHQQGAKLFLTCDCGISAFDQVEKARELGMRVVVTDHHEPKPILPIAHAVVNPHRSDSTYPFAELCGAGVALKLCAGLFRDLGHSEEVFYHRFSDLATLGTIADMMPLIDENRVIASHGIPRLGHSDKVGIKALLDVIGGAKSINTGLINFQVVPRINAVGRVDDAMMAFQLLVSKDQVESRRLAEELDRHNQDRKLKQEVTVREAIQEVESQGLAENFVIVVAKEDWTPGVIGLAAGKIAERFFRPTFVLTREEGGSKWKGSARSIPGFNLASVIYELRDILDGGGHAGAAGCSVSDEHLGEMRIRLEQLARLHLTPADLVPSVSVDLIAKGTELNENVLRDLERLQPFGRGNPEPIFLVNGVTLTSIRPMKNPCHVNARLKIEDGSFMDAICFGQGELVSAFGVNAIVDVVVQPELNDYMGSSNFRWNIKAIRPSQASG